MSDETPGWFPVASEHDVVPRHIVHGQLLGYELAIWRADDGHVNVWENRCLHRGVRLTVGLNDGAELVCRYHGWRYANRSGGCTYIPAHPADAPARTITNTVYPVIERYGLVWSTLDRDSQGRLPTVEELDGAPTTLRSLPVRAAAGRVDAALAGHRFAPSARLDAPLDQVAISVERAAGFVRLTASFEDAASTVICFVQPADEGSAVVRPVLVGKVDDELAVLRHHNDRLRAWVDQIEAAEDVVERSTPTPLEETPVMLPSATAPVGRTPQLQVRVARKWLTATDVAAFELVAVDGPLPTFQPGAHIDVHLPNGLVRQYSITNGPGDTASYRIGVKLEPESTGGSSLLHDVVRERDVLEISAPRNNFALRRDRERTVMVAGGIGVTPLLAMAQALAHTGQVVELHCFVRSDEHRAFGDVLDSLGDRVAMHVGRSPDETQQDLRDLLGTAHEGAQLYACGPPPMLAAIRACATEAGWPESEVHFEYFDNDVDVDDSTSFEVALARSALTLQVPAGVTLLDVLRSEGIALPSSCEKGACGTCAVPVVEGTPEHFDVHLTPAERAAGDTMLSCVSRAAAGQRLVLDL